MARIRRQFVHPVRVQVTMPLELRQRMDEAREEPRSTWIRQIIERELDQLEAALARAEKEEEATP